jgi:hypothetical protein
MELEKVLKTQAELIVQSADMLTSRLALIETQAREDERDTTAIISVFVIGSIKLYIDLLKFLVEKISNNEDDRNYYFLLPNARTLIDLYSRLLNLYDCHADDSKRALHCLTFQLLTYHKGLGGIKYEELLEINKEFLKSVNVEFPQKDIFSKNWVKDNKLPQFLPVADIFNEDRVKRNAPKTLGIFPIKVFYGIYANFSELTHANPYFYGSDSSLRTEKFWIISEAIIMTSMLIELVDKKILGKVDAKDHKVWLKDVDSKRTEMTKVWINSKRPTEFDINT